MNEIINKQFFIFLKNYYTKNFAPELEIERCAKTIVFE